MKQHKTIRVYENPYRLSQDYLKDFIAIADRCIEKRGRMNLLIEGHAALTEILCRLATLDNFQLWNYIHIFFPDENIPRPKKVPFVRDNLLNSLIIPEENIHVPISTFDDAETIIDDYEEQIIESFHLKVGEQPRFDLAIFSMMSYELLSQINDDQLSDTGLLRKSITEEGQVQMTLNPYILRYCRKIHVFGLGSETAAFTQRLIERDLQHVPLNENRPHHSSQTLTFYLDRFAAAQLSESYDYVDNLNGVSLVALEDQQN